MLTLGVLLQHEKFQSAPGSRVGTPAYLAPEVIMTTKGQTYDGKVIQTSLGHCSKGSQLSFANFMGGIYTQFACISLLSKSAFEMLFDSALSQDCWVLRAGHAASDDAWLSCQLAFPTTLLRMRTVVSSQTFFSRT